MKLKFLAFSLLAGIALNGCKNDKTVLLRLKYEQGDKQTYDIKIKAGKPTSSMVNNEIAISFFVVDHKQDDYILSAQVEAIKSHVKTFLYEFDYDSENPYSGKRDKIPGLTGVSDSIYTKMLYDKYALTIDERGRIMEPFKSGRHNETLQPINFKLIQLSFPEKPVKEGFSWSEFQENPLVSTENIFTYTVDSIDDNGVVIKVEVELTGTYNKKTKIKGEGKYMLDPKNGHLVNAYIEIPTGNDKALISIVPR